MTTQKIHIKGALRDPISSVQDLIIIEHTCERMGTTARWTTGAWGEHCLCYNIDVFCVFEDDGVPEDWVEIMQNENKNGKNKIYINAHVAQR